MFIDDICFDNQTCDKCKQASYPDNRVVELMSRTRSEGHHCIYICISCFVKIVNKRLGKILNDPNKVTAKQ